MFLNQPEIYPICCSFSIADVRCYDFEFIGLG